MSVRTTEEFAHEASRFSLRSLFPMSSTMRSQVSDTAYATPQPQPQSLPHMPVPAPVPAMAPHPQAPAPAPTQAPAPGRSQLRFNLPLQQQQQQQQTAAAPAQHDPFKFALPLKAQPQSQPQPQPVAVAPDPVPAQQAVPTAASASTPEFRPTALTSISGAANNAGAPAQASNAPSPTTTAAQPMAGGIPGVAAVRAMPIEAHEAEIARMVVAQGELMERLKLSESKLARTEASVMRGNQALATERVQFKQKIVSLTEEMNTLRANEKRATEELSLRADESEELSKLKLAMKELEERCAAAETTAATSAAQYKTLSDDYMELSSVKDDLQAEIKTHTDALAAKQQRIDSMAVELQGAKQTAATAQAQIDDLDAKLAELRVEQIFEPPAPAATGVVIPTGDELKKAVTAYIMKNYKSFKMDEKNYIHPGDRVMDRRTGRLATVQCDDEDDLKELVTRYPRVRYDDNPSVVEKATHYMDFIVITDEKSLPRPPWVPEYGIPLGMTSAPAAPAEASSAWTIAEREAEAEAEAVPTATAAAATPTAEVDAAFEAAVADALASMDAPVPPAETPPVTAATASSPADSACMVVRLTTHCKYDTTNQENEAKAARDHLAKHLHERCCTMGVNRAEGALAPDLHAYVETGAPSDALRAAQIANPAAATEAAVRTAVYVQAVSEDIKKRMSGQRDLWLQTVQIGAAA